MGQEITHRSQETYSKPTFPGTLVTAGTVDPQNLASSIKLHMKFLRRIPKPNSGKVKPKSRREKEEKEISKQKHKRAIEYGTPYTAASQAIQCLTA